jgi:energy-coupling factor transporter ATP-binding protein EcfA2
VNHAVNAEQDPEALAEREAIQGESTTAIEPGIARLRELGADETTAREAIAHVQRERLAAQELIVDGCLSLAARVPDTRYTLRPVLVEGQLITITGHNGAGKSTLAVAMAFALALEVPLGPLEPERAGLVYFVSAEDIAGTRLRIYAEAAKRKLQKERRTHVDNWLRWVHVNTPVHPARIAEAIRTDCGELSVVAVFIDTGPALFPGDDENSNSQQQLFAASCRMLTGISGAPCVVLLWHPAKSATADNLLPRGGSSLIGTVDANLTVWRDEDTFTLGHTKLRSEHFEPVRFQLEPVGLVLPSGMSVTVPVASSIADDKVEARDEATRERRERVLMALASNLNGNRLTLRDLAKAAKQSSAAVHDHLHRLARAKPALVQQDPVSDRYALTKAGQAAVTALRAKDAAAYRGASDHA